MATTTADKPFPRDECPSCDAGIVWTVTDRGARQPVDYEPAADGNLKLVWASGHREIRSTVVKPALAFGRTDLRRPHHMTCPRPIRRGRRNGTP